MSERPYLDFYDNAGVTPMRQSVDPQLHAQRRRDLLIQLGVPPGLVRGTNVLELGCGPGVNAKYLGALSPKTITLVEGSTTGYRALENEWPRHKMSNVTTIMYNDDILRFAAQPECAGLYDLVICEGVLPWQDNPEKMFRSICSLVAPGGVLVVSCLDAIGYLSESVRRALLPLLAPGYAQRSVVEVAAQVAPAFEPHLATIAGRSRAADDWTIDSIIAPMGGKMFPIDQALQVAEEEGLQPLGSSPRFLVDRRWHKAVGGDHATAAQAAYWEHAHWNIDGAFVDPPTRRRNENMLLRGLCAQVHYSVEDWRRDPDRTNLLPVREAMAAVLNNTAVFGPSHPRVPNALRWYLDLLTPGTTVEQVASMPDVARSWFGNGQQYVSFVKL